jgi:hypothetical protein
MAAVKIIFSNFIMPYKITKVVGGFKVVSKDNPKHVYAYHTKDAKAVIAAIEANKARRAAKK